MVEIVTSKELRYGSKIAGRVFFTKQLDMLGINKKYTGYFELVEIMNILINEAKESIVSFSRQVYPLVAKRFNVAEHTIERNIRNLIEKCWNKNMLNQFEINRIIENKPTCQDFIYMVKEFLEKQIL